MKKIISAIVAIFMTMSVVAQTISLDNFKNLKPRSIGPAGMSGRVTSIDAVVSNPDIIYLGTASGGVWKTENSGNTWSPIFDDQPILNIGSVAIQQSNPAVVWVGTGEGNPRNSLNIGGGIYKSVDAGKTWKLMGLEKTRNIHRIIVDPTNPSVIYAAAIGNPYSEHPERGVYKTTDGGENWNLILHSNDTSGCAELVMDPSNPNKLIANLWQHRRTPYSFTSGGSGSGLFITYDGGKNWDRLDKEDGLPEGRYGRIGIAFAPSDSRRVYALVEAKKNGLYKSDDGGAKWELVNSNASDVTNRPFYFQDIRVDPKNENRIYNVYQMISLSEDGGKTFKIIVPYSGIHPDHHAFWIHPNDPNLIIDGNDGGIGISRDRGKTWKFDEQLPVGQFYHINTDNEIPYHVMGGMQDNGSWRGPAYSWTEGGIRNYYWQSLWGGDGFDVSPDPQDSKWVYAMSQGGELGKYNVVTGQSMGLQPPPSNLTTKLRFNWNAAFAQSPQSPSTIYYASQFVHKSYNKGLDWQTISPDLTTNDSAQQNQDNNGGLSVDITGAENYNTIICVEPSAKDSNVLWAGTDDGNVQLTRDGGKTWINFRGKIPGMPLGAWVPQIRAGRHNVAEAFVVCNDYRRGDFQPYVFRTTNFGQTWQRMVDDKKVKGYALSMIQDPSEPNLIFVGTEHGLWISLDNGVTFKRWKNKYPAVSTYDLAIQEREADLCVATFGRAMYVFDDIRPLRAAAKNKGMNFTKAVTVFPAPTAYQYRERNVLGYDHSSWGIYEGDNRDRGAAYSFYINPQAFPISTDTAKKIKTDSAWVKIYNEQNDLIRTMKIKIDSGFNRMTWGFEKKGTRLPGSEKPKADAPEPGGRSVFPGNYKLVLTVADVSDSTAIAVVADPAITPSKTIYDAQLSVLDRIEKSNRKLVEITDRLAEAEETISKIESALKNDESAIADSLRNHGKSMADSLKNIRNFIMGKPQEKQGYGSPYQITVNDKLQEAKWEIIRKEKIPAQQEIRLIEMAESLVNDAVKKSNLFFEGPWKKYEQHANDQPIKLFKSYRPIE